MFGILVSGVIMALSLPTYINNQKMQAANDGMLEERYQIFKKIQNCRGSGWGRLRFEILFNLKTSTVYIVKENSTYSLKIKH